MGEEEGGEESVMRRMTRSIVIETGVITATRSPPRWDSRVFDGEGMVEEWVRVRRWSW